MDAIVVLGSHPDRRADRGVVQHEPSTGGAPAGGAEEEVHSTVAVQSHRIGTPAEVIPECFAERTAGNGVRAGVVKRLPGVGSVYTGSGLGGSVQMGEGLTRCETVGDGFDREFHTLTEATQGPVRVFAQPVQREEQEAVAEGSRQVMPAVGVVQGADCAAQQRPEPVTGDQKAPATSMSAAVGGDGDEGFISGKFDEDVGSIGVVHRHYSSPCDGRRCTRNRLVGTNSLYFPVRASNCLTDCAAWVSDSSKVDTNPKQDFAFLGDRRNG